MKTHLKKSRPDKHGYSDTLSLTLSIEKKPGVVPYGDRKCLEALQIAFETGFTRLSLERNGHCIITKRLP